MVDRIKNLDLTGKPVPESVPLNLSDLEKYKAYNGSSHSVSHIYDGDKFPGGYGVTKILQDDYWALREKSAELFKTNLYAAGIIRRLVTNEINTGLTPEACPDEGVLGVQPDSLQDWTETVENRFGIYAKYPKACDYFQRQTFGAIQRAARSEALIDGDVLVVLRWSQQTQLPTVQIISGNLVQSPMSGDRQTLRKGHEIIHGVERDSKKRVVAHWVKQSDGSFKRIPAFGEKSGRRISWLVYGTDKRHDDVRGRPMLSLVLQSLKEIDRYRDSAQRKALINSILAMVVTKKEDKIGSLPTQGGAVKRGAIDTSDADGTPRQFNFSNYLPGMVIDELQTGEDVVMKGGDGTDINFGPFEATIMQAIAWANEIPPEILMLAFSNNYSASQAAINEFKIYLNKFWSDWGECFCTPIYIEWLISEILLQKMQAPGLLEAWRDPSQYDVFGAWTTVDWYGSIKPSTDMLKQVKGSKSAIEEGLTTRARESRGLTGTKFSKNVRRLKTENTQLAEALEPLLKLQQSFSGQVPDAVAKAIDNVSYELLDAINEQ